MGRGEMEDEGLHDLLNCVLHQHAGSALSCHAKN